MTETASMEHAAGYQPLLALATPEIYRRNPFRVLGLAVNADPREVQRQLNRRQMQERLGISGGDKRDGAFALEPAPADGDIRAAVERLNQPVDRLLDEVFWFWPTHGRVADDPALAALRQGDPQAAGRLWREQAAARPGSIAAHNLAVLDHMTALDDEAQLTTPGADRSQQERTIELWVRALAHWKGVLEGEEFWSAVRDRVRDLNDQQLTTALVHSVRSTLPTALLLIGAKLACGAAERCEVTHSQRHLGLLRKANFGAGLAEEAIRESLRPARSRIKAAIRSAQTGCAATPQRGNRFVRELPRQTEAPLAIADTILPKDDLTRVGLHDMVAEAMLDGQVAYGKKTEDWLECIQLLELARELVLGDAMRSRLSENIEILQRNAEMGNDWCSPGYWSLPDDIIAKLESARHLTVSGDAEGAIRVVSVLDPKLGQPLRRALSHCLSVHGIRAWNEALSEQGGGTRVIRKVLARIGENPSLLHRRPDPNPYYPNPPCLGCSASSYTRWVNFTYDGLPLFLCSSCNEKDEREREQTKVALRHRLSMSLEYLLLASEVDPADTGVRRNLETLKLTAHEKGCSLPTTERLKERLGAASIRATRHEIEPAAEDGLCHFCGYSPADESHPITVPMCGDVRSVELLLKASVEYCYTDVLVPRCRRCRDEHRELPGRHDTWQSARSAVSALENFPDAMAVLKTAEDRAQRARATAEQHTQAVVAAQAAVEQARSIGRRCDLCDSDAHWRQGLCRVCDRAVFEPGWRGRVGRSLTWLSALAGLLASAYGLYGGQAQLLVPVVGGGAVCLFVGLALGVAGKQEQGRRQRLVGRLRLQELKRRWAKDLPESKRLLQRVTAALAAAESDQRQKAAAIEAARSSLGAAAAAAVAEFAKLHPRPRLSPGVKPESEYLSWGRIQTLLARGWGFGHALEDAAGQVSKVPIAVTGLLRPGPAQSPTSR